MTDTDRIDDLECEVAELRSEIDRLKAATFGTFSLPMKDTAAPAPIPGDREYMTCAMCGTQTAVGLWHICSPAFSPFTNVGVTS